MLLKGELDSFMQEAFVQAEEAYESLEVPIGCVIVHAPTRRIVARGRNRTNEGRDATRHAEMEAFSALMPLLGSSAAGSGGSDEDCLLTQYVLFVTVEPCIMCAAACRLLGLTRIWAAAMNERFGGCGSIANAHCSLMDKPAATLEMMPGRTWRAKSVMLLRRFYLRENERAPCPKQKARRRLKPVDS